MELVKNIYKVKIEKYKEKLFNCDNKYFKIV